MSLDSQLAELKAKQAEIEQEITRLQGLSPDERLAELLHEKLCHHNHIDGCGWYYEIDDPKVWIQHAHKRYLDQARRILAITSANIAIKVIEAIQ